MRKEVCDGCGTCAEATEMSKCRMFYFSRPQPIGSMLAADLIQISLLSIALIKTLTKSHLEKRGFVSSHTAQATIHL